MKLKLMLLALLAAVFLALPFKAAYAVDEFSSSYDVVYEIGEDGVAQVSQKITLKNLTSQYYASNFTLSIGSTTITDLSATSDAGAMEATAESKDSKTAINIKLNQQVAGMGKTQVFTLKFKSRDFAESLGKTWEINLPRVPEAKNIENYNLVLSVPVSFGDPTSISPTPKSESQTYDRLFFTFIKSQLNASGVSVNFGTTQVFDFTMKYHLENNTLFPIITSATLPPDTRYQDILISQINPRPIDVTVDDSGNYLAWYQLPRRSTQDITITGSAKLYITPKNKEVTILSPSTEQSLIKTDRYWEKDNPSTVAALAEIFKDGKPDTNREKARLIYHYVVNNLKYDNSRLNGENIERLGAVTVLSNPNSAVCMEFTDLFIALARAAGIPSRELDGFAYSSNKNLRPLSLSRDLLHAWPEYYDESRGWVMIDPTWENTSGGVDYFNKFDLNHLVLAIKGTSSQTPYVSDSVEVKVSEADFVGKSQIKIAPGSISDLWAGMPGVFEVKVTNEGNSAQPASVLTINADNIKIIGPTTIMIGPIPPFGTATYKFNVKTPLDLNGSNSKIVITIADQKLERNIAVKSLLLFYPLPLILFGVLALIAGIYGSILGLHLYKKRKTSKKNEPSSRP